MAQRELIVRIIRTLINAILIKDKDFDDSFMQFFCYDLVSIFSDEKTFLQDFLVILKGMLQSY